MRRQSGVPPGPEFIKITRDKRGITIAPTLKQRRRYADDCQNCGACCTFFFHGRANQPGRSVSLSVKEITKNHLWAWVARVTMNTRWIKAYANQRPQLERVKYFLRRIRNSEGFWTCAALRGVIGKHVTCSVYSRRPATCWQFEPGSALCLRAREWIGLKELIDEEEAAPQPAAGYTSGSPVAIG